MFRDENLADTYNMGTSYSEGYAVKTVDTAVNSYSSLQHPYATARFTLSFDGRPIEELIEDVVAMYHSVSGTMDSFRHTHPADFSTNNFRDEPTANDQRAILINAVARTWQMVKWYRAPGLVNPVEPRRKIILPIESTIKSGVQAADGSLHKGGFETGTGATVGLTTGIITLGAPLVENITGITKAAQAVLTIGTHTYTTNMSVLINGVAGMTQINGKRTNVVATDATTITVAIDSTGFSTYTSGGTTTNNPDSAAGEFLTFGCLFDLPVKFETNLEGVDWESYDILSAQINLIERRNI